MSKKVFVGLSGGVDSSVAAALLKSQGYKVTGVFMKNWSKPIGRYECPWQEDYRDAKRVATRLGINFEMYDFENEYFERVVEYMLDAFRRGITPNPDVMCNQEIKFRLFLDTAIETGAQMIATGHYAKVMSDDQTSHLMRAKDESKDQTYFLYRVEASALGKTLFPLGDYTKKEVRQLASTYKLPTATKKESMGICFVGKVGIREFLKELIGPQERGPIINQNGQQIGQHDGALFYTIGQRSGLGVGGGLPYYVTGKDMESNEVYVTDNISDPSLWTDEMVLTGVHWINKPDLSSQLMVRTRHRAPLIKAKSVKELPNGDCGVVLEEKVRALTPGQSTVFYSETECFGGGIVTM